MKWRVGGAVTQRSAKPFRRVRLSYVPPQLLMNSSLDGAIFALAILLVQGRLAVGNGLGQQIYGFLRLVDQTETLLAQ